MRRVWLALIVLLATFSSAPMGSVQQGAFERLSNSAPPPALAVARPNGESALAELFTDLPTPDSDAVTQLDAPSSAAALPNFLPVWPLHPLPGSRTAHVSLLERLPYDATAPPFRC
jgi:hypothetical protein